jgi:hypothetical protein
MTTDRLHACCPQAPVAVLGPAERTGNSKPAGPRFRLRILRERCKECADGSQKATRCGERDCPLWDYRTGHRPKGRKARRTPLRTLRAYCLWCCDGQSVEVRKCPLTGCPLWPWRRGQSANGDLPESVGRNMPANPRTGLPGDSGGTQGTNEVSEVI